MRIADTELDSRVELKIINNLSQYLVDQISIYEAMQVVASKYVFPCNRISGRYSPFILAPVEAVLVDLWPITWAFGPMTLWFITVYKYNNACHILSF